MIDLLERYRKDLKQRRFRIVLRLVGRNLIWWTVLATSCTFAFRYLPAIGAWTVFGVACIFFIGEAAWQVLAVWPLEDWDPLDVVSHCPHFVPWSPRIEPATEAQYEFLAGKGWRGRRDLRAHQALELMKKHLDLELGYAYLEKYGQVMANVKADKKAGLDDIRMLSPDSLSIQLEYRSAHGPATDKQIGFLESKGWKVPDDFTISDASELIHEWAHKEFAPDVWKMMYGSKPRSQSESNLNADTAED